MAEAIPIIDIAGYLAGRPGALAAVARQVHDALTTVGFFVLTGHDVPLRLIERTFEEARRFHQLPTFHVKDMGSDVPETKRARNIANDFTRSARFV